MTKLTKISWAKGAGDLFTARVGPFALKHWPKGDGRWNWQVFKDDGANPTASGIGSSQGAARTAAENFVKRSGLV